MPKHIELEKGRQFGRLTVVCRTDERAGKMTTKLWLLDCSCGGTRKATASSLIRGNVISCGCAKIDAEKASGVRLASYERYKKHGKTKTVEYATWAEMRRRCREEKAYIDRGTKVDDRWEGKDGFINFLADMGERPKGNYTIERKDNNGPYSPENCVWLEARLQPRNKSNTVYLTLNGVKRCISEWAEILKVTRSCLYQRYRKGWPVEKILATDPSL